MSQRAIKRYEEALAAKKAALEQENQEESSEDDIAHVHTKRVANAFDVLGNDADDDADDAESLEEIEVPESGQSKEGASREDVIIGGERDMRKSDHVNDKASVLNTKEAAAAKVEKVQPQSSQQKNSGDLKMHNVKPSSKAKKKLKKKRAKQRKRQLIKQNMLDDNEFPSELFREDDTEEFKKQVAQVMTDIERLNMQDTIANQKPTIEEEVAAADEMKLQAYKAIAPDIRHLNPDYELKRLFGARIIENERRAEDAAASRQQQRSRVRGRGQPSRRLRKRPLLVTPRESWIARAPGLSMVLDANSGPAEQSVTGVKYFKYHLENPYSTVQGEYRYRVSTHDPNALAQLVAQYPFHVDSLLQLAEIYRQMGELDRSAEMVERALFVLESAWTAAFSPQSGLCRLSYAHPENRSLYVALLRHAQLLTRRGLHRTSLEVLKMLLCLDPENDHMGVLLMIDSIALSAKETDWLLMFPSQFSASIPVENYPNFSYSCALGQFMMSKDSDPISRDKAETMLVKALLTFPMMLRLLNAAIDEAGMAWTKYKLYDDDLAMQGIDDGGALYRICGVYAERSKQLWKLGDNKALLRTCSIKAGELHLKEADEAVEARAGRKSAAEWFRMDGLYRNVNISDYVESNTPIPAELLAAEDGIGAEPVRNVGPLVATREFLRTMLPWNEPGTGQGNNDEASDEGRLATMLQAIQDITGRGNGNNTGQEDQQEQ